MPPASLATFTPPPLPRAAGMDLGLDHDRKPAEFVRDCFGFFNAESDAPVGNRDAVFSEQFFGLVFVDLHDLPAFLSVGFGLDSGRGAG